MTIPSYYKEIMKSTDMSPSLKELAKHLFIDALLLLLIYSLLSSKELALYFLAQMLWPILFFRFFSLMHDAVHSSVSKNIKINNLIGYIAGAFSFLPYYPWKKSHLEHHYWAGNIDKDPVMRIVREYDSKKQTKNKLLSFAWKSWIPLLALLQHVVFWRIGLQLYSEAKSKNALSSWWLSYILPATLYYLLYKIGVFTPVNLVPGLVLYLVMVEVVNFPHHLELPQNRGDKKLFVWEQHLISRSCMYSKIFRNFVLNNFNFHTEHHMYPQAPWYRLDSIHEKIKSSLGENYNYSFRSEWVRKNRKKNIEDVLVYKNPSNIDENKKAV